MKQKPNINNINVRLDKLICFIVSICRVKHNKVGKNTWFCLSENRDDRFVYLGRRSTEASTDTLFIRLYENTYNIRWEKKRIIR